MDLFPVLRGLGFHLRFLPGMISVLSGIDGIFRRIYPGFGNQSYGGIVVHGGRRIRQDRLHADGAKWIEYMVVFDIQIHDIL